MKAYGKLPLVPVETHHTYLYSNIVIYLHGAPTPDGKLLKKDPPVPFVLFLFVVLTLSTKHSAHKQQAGSGQIESPKRRVSVVQEATAAVLEPEKQCFALLHGADLLVIVA